ncbi:hypothetical protein CDD83_1726 [Cordyceps sp. RAO-2017]|nr:hypothetical protein CDD83_1726 [Cordyceps sp. RAO-2017]
MPRRPGFRNLVAAQAQADDAARCPARPGTSWSLVRRRRPISKIACDSCRARKVACDGTQPTCHQCRDRRLRCVYRAPDAKTVLQRLLAERERDFGALLDRLCSLSNDEAVDVPRRLRPASDLATALSCLGAGPDPRPPPAHVLEPPALWPRVELELTALHHAVYPLLAPLAAPAVDPADSPPGPDAAAYCDPRLRALDIAYWTAVPISDAAAAAALSLYLTRDHPALPLFDADLFLADLVDRRSTCCSALLVSSVLHLACEADSASRPDAWPLALSFFAEAEGLWRAEQARDSLLNVAAAHCLAIGCILAGRDALGRDLMAAGRRMAQRLRLLDVCADEADVDTLLGKPPDWVRFASHVAWGTYCLATLAAFNYYDEPVAFPPALPIPGDVGEPSADPWPPRPLPAYMGRTATEACRFFVICQEIASVCLGHGAAAPASLSFAEAKFRRLLAWAGGLPREALAGDRPQPHAILLHMWLHCVVLHLFRPFLADAGTRQPLRSFSSPDACPQTVSAASLRQLKHLTLIYCQAQPRSRRSPYAGPSLMQAMLCMLGGQPPDPDRRPYLLHVTRCWEELYAGYPLYGEIAQATWAVALRRGVVTGAEARRRMDEFRRPGRQHAAAPTSSLVADFDLAAHDVDAARIAAVANEFSDLVMFDELTINDDFKAQRP